MEHAAAQTAVPAAGLGALTPQQPTMSRGGLCGGDCQQVLGCLAKHGLQLAGNKSGLHTLTALVSMTSSDPA